MPRPPTLRHGAALAGIVLAAACSGDGGSAVDDTDVPASTPGEESALLAVVPAEDRVAVGVGEPRSPGYWVIWSSCGDGSEADTAAANGGRDAGWIILDDLLADPGMSLGGHPVSACEEGLDVLTTDSDPVRRLARQVLTAELNRNAGSESCGAADESIPVAQALLASLGYPGADGPAPTLRPGDAESVDRLVELLAAYNSGDLCR